MVFCGLGLRSGGCLRYSRLLCALWVCGCGGICLFLCVGYLLIVLFTSFTFTWFVICLVLLILFRCLRCFILCCLIAFYWRLCGLVFTCVLLCGL